MQEVAFESRAFTTNKHLLQKNISELYAQITYSDTVINDPEDFMQYSSERRNYHCGTGGGHVWA